MSRTSAHRPMWTRYTDPSVWSECHDHRDGPCDLIPLEQWAISPCDWWGSNCPQMRCIWEVRWYAIPPTCGCHMCTEHDERRAARRADRHAAKLSLRRGDWLDDLED